MFVIIRLVIEIFKQGEELGLSLSHSLEHTFGAMLVSILQWRAEIGIFNAKPVKYLFRPKYRFNVCLRNLNKFYTIPCMFLILLICVSDIELNGPRRNNTSYNFAFCHLNIVAHKFSKLSLLEVYNLEHKFDMICLLKHS